MATITLKSLKCVKKTDDAGSNDEIYLNLRTDGLSGRLPEDKDYWEMGDGETQNINRTYDFRDQFTVTEMENDAGSDDTVGEFTFVVQVPPPGSPLVFTGEESLYELAFEYTA